MSFVLEARHWVIMIGAVILATAALILAPQAVAIYPVTTYAFPIIAVATILDTLGTAAERMVLPVRCRPHSPGTPQRAAQRDTGNCPGMDGRWLAPPPCHLGGTQGAGAVF